MNSTKIASIYYFNYKGDIGFYESYRNFCLKNMVLFNLAIPGKKAIHVRATPTEEKISEESTKEIQAFVAEKLGTLTQIRQPTRYEIPEYFMIVYTDGISEYYQFDDEFYQIFKMCKVISGEVDTLLTPYLIFEDEDYAKKIKIMDKIAKSIKEKQIRDILSYASDDCVLEEDYDQYNRIATKKEIEKEIKKRMGFMGTKVSKAHIYTYLEGSLNESGESIVEIIIEARPHHGREVKYLLSPVFNEINEITVLKFALFDRGKKDTKTLFGDKLERAKQAVYNDFKTV